MVKIIISPPRCNLTCEELSAILGVKVQEAVFEPDGTLCLGVDKTPTTAKLTALKTLLSEWAAKTETMNDPAEL